MTLLELNAAMEAAKKILNRAAKDAVQANRAVAIAAENYEKAKAELAKAVSLIEV